MWETFPNSSREDLSVFLISFMSFFGENSRDVKSFSSDFYFFVLRLFFIYFSRAAHDLASSPFHSKYLTKGALKLGYSIQYFNIFFLLYTSFTYNFYSSLTHSLPSQTKTLKASQPVVKQEKKNSIKYLIAGQQ